MIGSLIKFITFLIKIKKLLKNYSYEQAILGLCYRDLDALQLFKLFQQIK